jgi:hypothetical protein
MGRALRWLANDRYFVGDARTAAGQLQRDSSGAIVGIQTPLPPDDLDPPRTYRRIVTVAPTATRLQEISGTYFSRELNTVLNLVVDQNRITVSNSRVLRPYAVTALSENVYTWPWNDAGYTAIFDVGPAPAGFTLSTTYGLGIRFRRVLISSE